MRDYSILHEQVDDITKEKALSRKTKKMLMADLEKIATKSRQHAQVSEVHSPPRMCEQAKNKGMRAGTSFDVCRGWDLRDRGHVPEMWRRLQTEQPDLVVLCPPCIAFTPYARMSTAKVMVIVGKGLHHMRISMLVAKWQCKKKKKWFMYEQPKGARSWLEPEVKEVQQPTLIVTNCPEIPVQVNCTFEEVEGDEEDDVPQERPPIEDVQEAHSGEQIGSYEPTPEEKKMVLKLHRGVGHPAKEDLIRLIRAARVRVRGEIIRWASKDFDARRARHSQSPRLSDQLPFQGHTPRVNRPRVPTGRENSGQVT